jgi:hypothetical protein
MCNILYRHKKYLSKDKNPENVNSKQVKVSVFCVFVIVLLFLTQSSCS